MADSNEERLARIEVKTDNQEEKLHNHEERLKVLEESNKETIELRYDLRSLSDKLSTFVDSQNSVNSSIQEAISLLKNKTDELENAPKQFLWNLSVNGLKSLIIKLIPWLFTLSAIIYAYLQNK